MTTALYLEHYLDSKYSIFLVKKYKGNYIFLHLY